MQNTKLTNWQAADWRTVSRSFDKAIRRYGAYGVSAQALIPYAGGLNHYQNCTPASEDGLKKARNK
jgi:hypothetical protein